MMNASRGRILALAMLPVFVVGTLPQVACICADGHREMACPKLKGGVEKHVRSCCAAKSHAGVNQLGHMYGVGARVVSCCRVVIESPPATVVVKQSRATDELTHIDASDRFVSHSAEPSFRAVRSEAAHWQPPPRDAVIWFSRLTI